ncbi:STAS domain-containing protein [Pseudoalteromonas sp.]|uniref:STAS domain-containing protein n=1 Tax=Pseudoalteromonas sp. TaxID=53249 RepID=UPI002602557C|nr:STAS domain-containing protein [Pseudoalteromonas sp.]MCP4586899.1 STAS domain-containing protein [Pseudoalteromonas sp.]
MLSSREEKDGRVIILVGEKFDYSVHQSFRDAYRNYTTPRTAFVIDLAKTKFMDSSALGMALLLKEHAEKLGGTVEIRGASGVVQKTLEIANFHMMFKVS